MIDIAVNELHKYYGSNHVLKGISFEIYKGEKIGLLGKNGSGKTTLFKVITGDEHYESGSISKASGRKIEVLAQIPDFGRTDTVEDILYSSFAEINEIQDGMRKIEGNLDQSVLLRYGKLMEEYERLGGYEVEVKVEKICGGMNIGENLRKSPFRLLSGGEKTRVNLARILLRDCDILLLDEPTNHLDLASLEWLEKFLREYKGTVVVISHDRVFLDNVVMRIIELDDGKANFYSGNYSFYVEEKEQRYLTQAEQYKQQQRKIKQLETAIKRQRVWVDMAPGNTGLGKRKVAMEKRLEQMDKVDKPVTSKKMTEDFNSGGHAAKQMVLFDSVFKSYGSNVLLNDLNIIIGRNDSIALIGANGCGKTTLIRLIMDEEPCDSGIVKVSSNVKIAYLPQIIRFDDENATVLQTLRNITGLPEDKNRAILVGFRFRADDVMKKVGNLSGGERSRLKLCLLMQNKANFLILDEPTNHLDIESREWIEEAIADFEGTMLFISHDRYFLNKFASRIWSMKDGSITDYHGGFEDFLEFSAVENKPTLSVTDKKKKKPADKTKEPLKNPVPLETLISELESEIEKTNGAEKQRLKARLDSLYNEWLEGGDDNA